MRSKTIGSATAGNNTGGATADYTSIQAWEDTIADTDDETGTIITKVAGVGAVDTVLDAASTARTYLLTADSDCFFNAAAYTAMSTRARMQGNNLITGAALLVSTATGWVLEKFSILDGGTGYGLAINNNAVASIRRMGIDGMVYGLAIYGGSATFTASNMVLGRTANNGGYNIYVGHSGSGGVLNLYQSSWAGASSGIGIASLGTVSVNACIGVGAAFGDFNALGGTMTGNYNVSSDTSAVGSASTKYLRSVTATDWLTNIGKTTEDFAIPSGRQGYWAANKDAIDQTGYPADVSTDVVGTARSAPIDPGCWQTPASAATTYHNLMLLGVGG